MSIFHSLGDYTTKNYIYKQFRISFQKHKQNFFKDSFLLQKGTLRIFNCIDNKIVKKRSLKSQDLNIMLGPNNFNTRPTVDHHAS